MRIQYIETTLGHTGDIHIARPLILKWLLTHCRGIEVNDHLQSSTDFLNKDMFGIVSDCCVMPNEKKNPAISWGEEITFQCDDDDDDDDDDARFILDQHAELDFIVLIHQYNNPRIYMSLQFTPRTHYSESKQTSICFYS